jgi:hypothetical protein
MKMEGCQVIFLVSGRFAGVFLRCDQEEASGKRNPGRNKSLGGGEASGIYPMAVAVKNTGFTIF